jgi:hypothetical protein
VFYFDTEITFQYISTGEPTTSAMSAGEAMPMETVEIEQATNNVQDWYTGDVMKWLETLDVLTEEDRAGFLSKSC